MFGDVNTSSSCSGHLQLVHRIHELFHGAEAEKALSSAVVTDPAGRVSLWTDWGSCVMMMAAAASDESLNRSTEDKTSSRRQNEGEKQHFIYCFKRLTA